MRLRNCSTNEVVAANVHFATSLLQRTIGLLQKRRVAPSEGLWFRNACMIHTVGMRTAIDVIFVDGHDRIVQLRPAVRPNRLVVACVGAASVIELGAGALEGTDLLIGDRLLLEP